MVCVKLVKCLHILQRIKKMVNSKLKSGKKPRIYVRQVSLERKKNRPRESIFHKLVADEEQFMKTLRMPLPVFNVLHELLKPKLRKNSIRTPISTRTRLLVTLLYLAHGSTRQYHTLLHKMRLTTFRRITLETCDLLWDMLAPTYLAPPNQSEWESIAEDFAEIWNMPNCIGAIDGKHINITCPRKTGSMYYNCKGKYSIVLLAMCDANYTFTCVEIGAYGDQSDSGAFNCTTISKAFENNEINIPSDSPLPGEDEPFPHYLVADSTFPLRRFLMKPYPSRAIQSEQEYFNKRLSRAKRIIENCFGILTAKWKILQTTLCLAPQNADKIVKACVVLHNFVKLSTPNYITVGLADHEDNGTLVDGAWRKMVLPLPSITLPRVNRCTTESYELRDSLKRHLYNNQI